MWNTPKFWQCLNTVFWTGTVPILHAVGMVDKRDISKGIKNITREMLLVFVGALITKFLLL